MELILKEDILIKMLDREVISKLKEAEQTKAEYKAKKLELEQNENIRKIKEALNTCWSFHAYLGDFIESDNDEYKEKSTYVYIFQFRNNREVYSLYIHLARECGFELVDKIIQEKIDLTALRLSNEDVEE